MIAQPDRSGLVLVLRRASVVAMLTWRTGVALFTVPAGLARLAVLTRLARVTRLAGFARLPRLTMCTGLAMLPRLTGRHRRRVLLLGPRTRFGRRFGVLFQNGALLTDLDVFENVAFPVRQHSRLPEPLLRRLVLMKLQAVGLRGAERLMPQELSGGMARRVALARAIVMDPEVLIYDEPFVGLDPISMGVVCRLIRQLNDALGITSILVSHDVQEVATIADRSYLLADGKVVASGSSPELHASTDPAVRQFMDGAADGPVPFHYPAGDYREQLLDVGDLR